MYLTCCRARCLASRCGLMVHEACRHLHTRQDPIAFCNRTKIAPPIGSSSLFDYVNSAKKVYNVKMTFFFFHLLSSLLQVSLLFDPLDWGLT